MNKAQTAVPAIILTVMALLIWYLLWIPPQQRYELLFGPQQIIDEEPAQTEFSYFSANVGEIGSSNGTLLYSTTVNDLYVSYPFLKMLINSYEYSSLSSTLFYSGSTTLRINNDYDLMELELNAGNIIGTPKLLVKVNGSTVYENELLSNSKTSIKLPFIDGLSAGKEIEVICKFNGNSLFNSQKCNFDSIKIYNYEYYIEKENDSKTFYLNPQASLAELMELSFEASKFTEYEAVLKINDKQVFRGALNNNTKKLSIDLEGVALSDYANTISMQASKGAEYYLDNVSLNFYALPSAVAERYFVFDLIPNAFGATKLGVYLNVTGIIQKGDIYINIISKDSVFIYTSDKLVLGINKVEIPIAYFTEKANNLKLSSPNGRIIISNIKIKE